MGLKGAVSSTLATWTKQGIAEFSGATSLNSAGESKKDYIAKRTFWSNER